jgi:hypothetical protein
MTGFVLATIDFEASALAQQGEPIEVGIALWEIDKPILSWSSLIYPSANMLWSQESAEIHGILREQLACAPHPARVAARLNELMANSPVAFCDGGESDERWLFQLYEAGGLKPCFRLAHFETMPGTHLDVIRNKMWAWLEATKPPHRAGSDAVRLMHAYAFGQDRQPEVEIIS